MGTRVCSEESAVRSRANALAIGLLSSDPPTRYALEPYP